MNFLMKSAWSALLLAPAIGLAPPASAAFPLADPSQPGSVIVFPKWITGTVVTEGTTLPKTEIELGAVCPVGVACAEHAPIKVRLHWVCGGADKIDNKFICPSDDFDVTFSVDGKAVFDPENLAVTGSVRHVVPHPPFNVDGTPCTRGYLIGYVVNLRDQPVRFDGLVGDAVIRNSNTAVSAYKAITIQADPALANYDGTNFAAAAIGLTPDPFVGGENRLPFDGKPGHYAQVTGQISGDVKYDDPVGPTFVTTGLTLLTLDVRQNQPNYPTFAPLTFWSEDEVDVSTPGVHFICFGTFTLSTQIDANLTRQQMGTRKGVFVSQQAFKSPIGGIEDEDGPVTLLGLVHTFESAAPGGLDRSYVYEPFNNGAAVPTFFLPPCNALGQC